MNIQTIKELSSKAFPARIVSDYKKFNKDYLLDSVDSFLITFTDGLKSHGWPMPISEVSTIICKSSAKMALSTDILS